MTNEATVPPRNPWLDLPLEPPYVLRSQGDDDDDARVLDRFVGKLKNDCEVQRNLLPVPFFGDPKRAEVYLLVSNPGYDPTKNDREHADPAFQESYRASLRHKLLHPYLDPNFDCVGGQQTGGFQWWRRRLGDLFCRFTEAEYSAVASRLMCVQLFPYHSRCFCWSVARRLPSQGYSLYLVEEAIRQNKEIIVLRAPWRDVINPMLKKLDCVDYPYYTVATFQRQRTPSVNPYWIGEEPFERIVGRIQSSI